MKHYCLNCKEVIDSYEVDLGGFETEYRCQSCDWTALVSKNQVIEALLGFLKDEG